MGINTKTLKRPKLPATRSPQMFRQLAKMYQEQNAHDWADFFLELADFYDKDAPELERGQDALPE